MEVKELEQKGRSAQVVQAARAAEARRRGLADGFRARLEAALAQRGATGAVEQDALLAISVSCFVEVQEISSQYLRAKAGRKALVRLQICRSELRRCLRCLGLVSTDANEPSEPREQSLADWWRERGEHAVATAGQPDAPEEGA